MTSLACPHRPGGVSTPMPPQQKMQLPQWRARSRMLGGRRWAVRQGPPFETAFGQQLAFLATQADLHHLFLPALHDTLQQLKEQRVGLRSGAHSHGAAAGDVTSLIAAQLREAQLRQNMLAAEELIYVWCVYKLTSAGISLLQDVDELASEEVLLGRAPGVLGPLPLHRLLSPAVADAVVGLVASTFGDQQAGRSPASLLTCIDRLQASRLFAGHIEYGYFVRGMEARCLSTGINLGEDSSQLVAFAGQLAKEELRAACAVGTLEAWRAAVRHTGHVFGLQPAAARQGEGSSSLPYPQLEVTSTGAQLAPLSHLSEYFSKPGAAAEAAAAAAARAARGWKQEAEAESLPAPDLVTMRLDALQQLLLQGAALGALLYDAEVLLQCEESFALTPR